MYVVGVMMLSAVVKIKQESVQALEEEETITDLSEMDKHSFT